MVHLQVVFLVLGMDSKGFKGNWVQEKMVQRVSGGRFGVLRVLVGTGLSGNVSWETRFSGNVLQGEQGSRGNMLQGQQGSMRMCYR